MKYGPQTPEIKALIERARNLTDAEARELGAAWEAAWEAAEFAARYAAWVAAGYAAWEAERYAAMNAAEGAAWGTARYAAWVAAWEAERYDAMDAAEGAAWEAAEGAAEGAAWEAACDAARALAVRDLISPDGFTQEHYDLLTEPWSRVIGPAAFAVSSIAAFEAYRPASGRE